MGTSHCFSLWVCPRNREKNIYFISQIFMKCTLVFILLQRENIGVISKWTILAFNMTIHSIKHRGGICIYIQHGFCWKNISCVALMNEIHLSKITISFNCIWILEANSSVLYTIVEMRNCTSFVRWAGLADFGIRSNRFDPC